MNTKISFGLSSSFFEKPEQKDWEAAAQAGFTHVELCMMRKGETDLLQYNRLFGEKMARDIKAAGMTLWSAHLPFGDEWDISTLDAEKRKMIMSDTLELISAATAWGAQKAVFHTSYEPIALNEREERLKFAREGIHNLSCSAQTAGITLAVEVLPRTCLGNCSEELLFLLGDSPAGICFDVNHLLLESHKTFIENCGRRIQTLHLSDYDFVDERHWFPGDGKIDWKALINTLEGSGYQGPYLFEVRSSGFRGEGTPGPLDVLDAFQKAILR